MHQRDWVEEIQQEQEQREAVIEWSTDIGLAKKYWDNGQVLPLDLAAKLMEAGYDVERLEERYLIED